MPRFTAPTRYEMLLAAERAVARQVGHYLRTGEQELLRAVLLSAEDLRVDIEEYESQMLGLWRLDRADQTPTPESEMYD